MPDHGQHCPFLNRTDSRCGEHLKIDQLGHAFEYCFDVYAACPVYLDLLIERRTKSADVQPKLSQRMEPNAPRIVQVTVRRSTAHSYAKRAA